MVVLNGFRRGRKLVYGFCRWFFKWFPPWQENICSFMVPVLAAAGETISGSSQVRDCAGDTRARSDSDSCMRSPAAKDPDLTSGLRGFNPGRARFQGNCVCLFLLTCCLLLFVFCFLPEPGGKAEKQCYLSCFRSVSVTFPLRFRCVSVARLPVASA